MFVCVLLQSVLLTYVTAKKPSQCTFIVKTSFDNCGSRKAELKTFKDDEKNRIYNVSSSSQNNISKTCTNCRSLFNVARFRRHSFSSKTLVQISDMLHRCCGNCTKYYLTDIFTAIDDTNRTYLDKFDIIYPAHAESSLTLLHGFHFIPVYNIPSAYYFTIQKSDRKIALSMVYGCLNMWPLLAICILMSFIAGFIAWIMETWSNKEEFPRPFLHGLLEGFWWSFVSMTTVGYGDKSPKSIPARIFAVFWILTGITICSIYVAALTTQIMEARSTEDPQLVGMKVGALRHRLHDSLIISQHGGILREIEFNNTVVGVIDLVRSLERGEIDGFLVSRSTYYYYARVTHDVKKYRLKAASIRHVKMVKTEKHFRGEKLVTGMLVKSRKDYEYFRQYFKSNWLQIQGCYSYDLNYKDKKFVRDGSNPVAGLFFPFFGGSLIILAVIGFFGIIYEIRRYVIAKRGQKCEDEEEKHVIYETAIME